MQSKRKHFCSCHGHEKALKRILSFDISEWDMYCVKSSSALSQLTLKSPEVIVLTAGRQIYRKEEKQNAFIIIWINSLLKSNTNNWPITASFKISVSSQSNIAGRSKFEIALKLLLIHLWSYWTTILINIMEWDLHIGWNVLCFDQILKKKETRMT